MAVVSELALALNGFWQKKKVIEQAGISYEFNLIKNKLALGLCTLPVFQNAAMTPLGSASDLEKIDDTDMRFLDKEDSKYVKYVSKLDPSNFKDQDHYKVLGLSKLRYKATMNQLKLAYRQKVLKYHPDKGNVEEKDQKNEKVFACIQKAYEQLGLSADKRKAYDSVDPTFKETIPGASEVSKENFFDVLGPVFQQNARFSIVQPVPLLGDKNSDRAYVDSFYEFWFNWSSWREFSYLDSEDKTKGEDKWERREIEKINKAEREKRRKKDLKRISNLMDLAYEKDPRVAAFKDADRRQKELAKESKRLERERKEQLRKEQEEEEKRVRQAERQLQLKQEKQASQEKQKKRKVLTAQRKKFRDLCIGAQYWTEDDTKRLDFMEQIEKICLNADFEQISALCEKLTKICVYDEAIETLKNCIKPEPKTTQNGFAKLNQTNSSNPTITSASAWSSAELQLLVKAVSLFPPGTGERWRSVAEYVTIHGAAIGGKERTEKEVIKQVKTLSAVDCTSAPANQIKNNDSLLRENEAIVTNNNDYSAKNNKKESAPATNGENADNWSTEQQKQLETALKSIPGTDPYRWEKIAGLVTGKTKKECVKRYKHLAELVKQSKIKC